MLPVPLKELRKSMRNNSLWAILIAYPELLTDENVLLLRAVKNTKGPVRRWWGHTGSGGKRRVYKCNICGDWIDTESAKWKPTAHASKALREHKALHLAEGLEGLQPIG